MDVIKKYFPNLTSKQISQFEALGILYPEWNEKINVISRKDIANLYVNHILHSLSVAKFISFKNQTKILDMGTGGGFPGIPLAVIFPECHFHLIDRIGKKIRVANDISTQIGLTNVSFQHGDIGECHKHFDFVVSRAVMRLDELVPLIKKNVDKECRNGYPNGLICLKGGDISDEMKKVKYPMLETNLTDYFNEDFFHTKKLIYVNIR